MAAALGEGVENAWIEGSSGAYDVYVRDGLAFVSHWDAGLVILDVGNGIAGGSPTNPVEVSRVQTEGGNTNSAWYWPDAEGSYVLTARDKATGEVLAEVPFARESDRRPPEPHSPTGWAESRQETA